MKALDLLGQWSKAGYRARSSRGQVILYFTGTAEPDPALVKRSAQETERRKPELLALLKKNRLWGIAGGYASRMAQAADEGDLVCLLVEADKARKAEWIHQTQFEELIGLAGDRRCDFKEAREVE